jgi:hypothetical protein
MTISELEIDSDDIFGHRLLGVGEASSDPAKVKLVR